MSDFFDNIGKVFNETAKQAAKISGDMVELTKTSVNIKFDEIKRDGFFKEIGKISYAAYKTNPQSVSEEIADFCKCVEEIEISINEQKNKAAIIKKQKYCPGCGKKLELNTRYCPDCGEGQPEPAMEEECGCGCGCDCGEDDSCCGEDGNANQE